MATINFLEQHRREVSKSNVFDQRLYTGSLVLMAATIFVTILLLGSNFFLQLRVSEVQAREKDLEKSILFQEEIEKSVVILAKKLEVIAQLLALRYNKQETITYFTTVLGENVVLKGIDYAEEANVLSIQVEAVHVFALDAFSTFLETPEVKNKYPSITKSEMRRDQDGTYVLTITVPLAGEEGAQPKKTP